METILKDLRNQALEMERYLVSLIAKIKSDEDILEKSNETLNRVDPESNNPRDIFIRDLAQDNLNKINLTDVETERKNKLEEVKDTIIKSIKSEYEKYKDHYKGNDDESLDRYLERLSKIENNISVNGYSPGIFYKLLVYDTKDFMINETAHIEARKLYYDALKYLHRLGVDYDREYVSTDMLAENLNISDVDIVVTLKNLLIERTVLDEFGRMNYEKVRRHLEILNNSTDEKRTQKQDSHNNEELELMPFFGKGLKVDGNKAQNHDFSNNRGPKLMPFFGIDLTDDNLRTDDDSR